MSRKRNVVLITLDSLRADHCSFMGYPRETTPTIDDMARNGLYFENAITSGVGTPASMTCTFTGSYCPIPPTEIRPEPWRNMLSRKKTLAQVLSENGYYTGAIHPNPFASSYFGFNKGFDYFQDFLLPNQKGIIASLTRKLKNSRRGKLAILRNFLNLVQREEVFKPWESYYDSITGWIKNAKRPFFLWVLLLDTHHPYLAPRKFARRNSPLDYYDLVSFSWEGQKANWQLDLPEKKRMKIIDAYDDSILHADSFVKKLWDDLQEEDPVFIIHADHGDGFGEHGFYSHPSYLYEELLHVPLVIYNSGIKGKAEQPVSLLELSPTILELMGIKAKFPSKSFLNESRSWAISQITESNGKKIAIRVKEWKFITGQNEIDELYNLEKDPHEQINLLDGHPQLAKQMEQIIQSHRSRQLEEARIQSAVSKLSF